MWAAGRGTPRGRLARDPRGPGRPARPVPRRPSQDLFDKPAESRDRPDGPACLEPHLACATHRLPMSREVRRTGPEVDAVERWPRAASWFDGEMLQSQRFRVAPSRRRHPRQAPTRTGSSSPDGELLGTTDEGRALGRATPAPYLHKASSTVNEPTWSDARRVSRPIPTSTRRLATSRHRGRERVVDWRHRRHRRASRHRVTEQVVGYVKLFVTNEIVDEIRFRFLLNTSRQVGVVDDPGRGHRSRRRFDTRAARWSTPSTPRRFAAADGRAIGGTWAACPRRCTPTRASARSSSTTGIRAGRGSASAGSATRFVCSRQRSRRSGGAAAHAGAPPVCSRRNAETGTSRSTSWPRPRCWPLSSAGRGDETAVRGRRRSGDRHR